MDLSQIRVDSYNPINKQVIYEPKLTHLIISLLT